jgi:predicted nucleic acid-binding protein
MAPGCATLGAAARGRHARYPTRTSLIAAHTLDLSAVLVTNNSRHFSYFQADRRQLEDWTGNP